MASSGSPRNKGFAEALNAAGLNEEVRASLTSAFDALNTWRSEVAAAAEKHSVKVYDKMSAAAKIMGWPPELVDLTRQQMEQANKMQLQMIDQVMDVWEAQVKNPGMFQMPGANQGGNPFAAFDMSNMMKDMPQFPGMPNINERGAMDFSNMSTAPLQFWMQAADMWQKSWQQALSSWMEAQSNMMGGGDDKPRNRR